MTNRSLPIVAIAVFLAGFSGHLSAQGTAAQAAAAAQKAAASEAAAPPPATKLEGFKPAAGSVVTFGYDNLGSISGTVSVDAREMRDQKGAGVRGVVVAVDESQYRSERAFIDADELPDLIKGIDALLEVKANPTPFQNFEVRYTTRGELQLTAFSSRNAISFAVQAGRITRARTFISLNDMQKLRTMFVDASKKIASLPPK